MKDWCEGCDFCSFPYKAQVPIAGYGVREFNCKEDIMEAVEDLVEDINRTNKQSDKTFDVYSSVNAYLPHFTCTNNFLEQKYQDDINRYVFSKEYNVQAYPGSYGNFPRKWISKVNIISRALDNVKTTEQAKLKKGK